MRALFNNPAEYNGFKIGIGKTTLYGSEIQELRRLIELGRFVYGQGTLRSWNIINSYNDFIRQDIHIARQGMKIVIDAGNRAGGQIAVTLFQSLGLEVVPLYCEMVFIRQDYSHFFTHSPQIRGSLRYSGQHFTTTCKQHFQALY